MSRSAGQPNPARFLEHPAGRWASLSVRVVIRGDRAALIAHGWSVMTPATCVGAPSTARPTSIRLLGASHLAQCAAVEGSRASHVAHTNTVQSPSRGGVPPQGLDHAARVGSPSRTRQVSDMVGAPGVGASTAHTRQTVWVPACEAAALRRARHTARDGRTPPRLALSPCARSTAT